MLGFIFKEISQSKKPVVNYILISLILWGINIFTPYLSGIYLNQLLSGMDKVLFAAFIISFTLANVLQMISGYFQAIVSVRFNQEIAYNISNDIFQKIFRSEYKQYKNIDCAYFVDQINKDSRTIVRFISSNIVNLFFQIATIIISGIVIFRADHLLCLIVFLLIPFYLITFFLNKKQLFESHRVQKEASNEYFSRYSEQMNKLAYVKRNSLNYEAKTRLYNAFDKMLKANLHSMSSDYMFTNLNQIVIIFAYICIIGIGGHKVSSGELSIGIFSVINTYFNMMIGSVSYFVGIAGSYQDTKISFDRIKRILQVPDETTGNRIVDLISEVEVEDFSLQCNDQIILSHYDLKFQAGTIYGICGKNGTGKTTLLNALVGLFFGEVSGSIRYNGIEINQLDMPTLRRQKISYLEQDPVMLNMSVRDYLHFGIEQNQVVSENQKRLLKVWDIGYLLDKEMNENGSNFSGGEKQKLALVRALSKESSLILLDEPTSALDKSSTAKLIDLLQDMKSQAIIIVVSHDWDMLEHCDEVIDLDSVQHFKAAL